LRDDIVGVGGSNETRNGNADAFGKNTGGEIAEVAAGNGDNQGNRGDGQLAVSCDVIEHLRKQTAHVDGVGGGKKRAMVELLVGEGLFDETLAVIEGAGDFKRGDVLSERGELLFLSFADAFRGIENDDANVGHAQKAVSDGAAGVAGSCDQNGKRAGFAANEVAHEAGHEAGAKIFEGQCGAVEEFEDVQRRRERDQFDGEIDGFGDDLPQNFFGYVGSSEGPH